MRPIELRYTIAAILTSLVVAMALTQTGCLRTRQSSADETAPGDESPSAARPPAGERPAGKQPAGGEPAESDELQQPLLRELGKALDDAPDLEDSDRNEAWKILREADPILTQIKEENRKAIEAANRPPQIRHQRSKKPKKAEEAPDPKEAKEPEA